jgi:hypothetical protein
MKTGIITQLSLFGNGISWCGICGRKLSNPLSVYRGIGPICYGRHRNGDSMMDSDFCDKHLAEPLENGVILKRDEQGTATNVPHLVVHHSPTGFEWGYGGSGPADLALNIVEIFLNRMGYAGERMKCYDGDCFKLAWRLHQDFKWKFVANADRDNAIISYNAIMAYMEEKVSIGEQAEAI